MARRLDYLSDITDSCLLAGGDYRKRFIDELPCAFGDTAGGSVTPPQTWERLRWFLPHIRYNGSAVQSLHADGGRAAEIFAGPLRNPGTEVSLKALGALLRDPQRSLSDVTEQAVDDVYGPKTLAACGELAGLIREAEAAYFDHVNTKRNYTPMLEHLFNVFPGKPIYLTNGDPAALEGYEKTMEQIKGKLEALRRDVRRVSRLDDTITAVGHAAAEAGQVRAGVWK